MYENIDISSGLKETLSAAVSQGRLSHAIIFEGSSRQIRLDTATETAKAILCHGDCKPCGVCGSCMKVSSLSHPDLFITQNDGAMIKIDEIRDIRKKAKVYPNDGDKSVFIIHDAENMNPPAQNALLKIFEEPARHIAFILTCSTRSALLETITSRATIYFLGEEITGQEDTKGLETATELLESFISANELQFLKKTAVLRNNKPLFLSALNYMILLFRDALVLSSGKAELICKNQSMAEKLRKSLTQKRLVQLIEGLGSLKDSAEASANHNLSITRLSSILYSIK